MSARGRDVQWADGIRGIGSIFIVTGHIVRAFMPNYLSPADKYDGEPHLFQRPFLRVIAAGPFWVALFCALSGYVCAIKPLQILANKGHVDEARKVIASTVFRRVFRIGIPATLATMLSWALCQLGAWRIMERVRYWGDWIQFTEPKRLPGIILPLRNLFKQCFHTWTLAYNTYDQNQWTLALEMRGSMRLLFILSIAVGFTPFWRRVALIISAIYFSLSTQYLTTLCFFCGALLADLSIHLRATQYDSRPRHKWQNYWTYALVVFALFMASIPPENPNYVWYTRIVYQFFEKNVTVIEDESDRLIASIGALSLIIAFMYNPSLRQLFSGRYFVFLGSISFPIYLLHGVFIRLPLQWAVIHILPRLASGALVVYDMGNGKEEVELRCRKMTCKFAALILILSWFALLFACCVVWKRYVNDFAFRVCRFAEESVMGTRQTKILSDVVPHQNLGEPWLWSQSEVNTSTKVENGKID